MFRVMEVERGTEVERSEGQPAEYFNVLRNQNLNFVRFAGVSCGTSHMRELTLKEPLHRNKMFLKS